MDSNDLNTEKSISKGVSHFSVNPIDVLKYQKMKFEVLLNFMKVNWLNKKSNFQLNGVFAYGFTATSDSIKVSQGKIVPVEYINITNVNTTTYGLNLTYELKVDSRIGIALGYDFRWIDLASDRFESKKEFSSLFHRAFFEGFYKVGDESKLFFRFRKNWLDHNNGFNFYQIQLGYQLNLFKGSND